MCAALERGKQQMLYDWKCFAMVFCAPAPVVGRCERVEFLIPFNLVALKSFEGKAAIRITTERTMANTSHR